MSPFPPVRPGLAAPAPQGEEPPPLPTVIDVEASGFGRDSYPIEVGFVLPGGQAHCTLIRPQPGWDHWDADAERTHGIHRRLLEQRGRDAPEVARWLNRHLRGQRVHSDAWGHDFVWLHRLFAAAGEIPAFRLEPLQSLFGEHDGAEWDEACRRVREELASPRHRASADARVLQRAFGRLRAQRSARGLTAPSR